MFVLQGIALATSLLAASASAISSQSFSWKNVRIGGGGGFIPGIVFNPSEKGLAYARADIGGAYKLNADDTWTPLLDFANNTNWHDWGIDAIATDPVDTNNLYLAVGMYTNDWDPNDGSILRSSDQGTTWTETKLPFKVGGNMPGRGVGERLAVDPNDNSILYFGARSGHGLWKSTDSGVTWSNVTSFKWTGTYFQNASSSYTSDPVGIAWVTFDSTSGTKGSATPRIFVGVVDIGQSVFKSEDGGATWAWVSGEPQLGFLPHKGVLSPAEKTLYVTYANGAGPYDGTNGTVHKYDISTGVWTDISPSSLTAGYYGYGGFAVDLQKPGTIMVAALNCWWPDEIIWRSNNSGATWSPIWDWASYPTMNLYYDYNIDSAPWLQDNTSTAQFLSRVGWMVEALAIDPFDSNHWLYGTGATIYGGHDLLKWDTVHNVTLESLATGIEETAVLALISPPGGPPLLSAVGDIGGFYHSDLDTPPAGNFHTPTYGTTNDLDYAGNKPANIVRTGASSTDVQIAVSADFGLTWNQDYGFTTSTGPGNVAYSADADTVLLISSTNGPIRSQYTSSFTSVSTLPSGAAIASDKRNNTYFYGGSAGSFYLSSDTGSTFAKTVALGSSTAVNQIRVHPTVAGDVWAATDVGLFHSTNFGQTFTQISGPTEGWSFALGAPSKTGSYPVIYGFFTVSGTTALFKTEDEGTTWVVISDAQHGFGAVASNVVGADISLYGRVYVGTNGRGIFYGGPEGTLSTGTTSSSVVAPTSVVSSISVALSSAKSSSSIITSAASSTVASSTIKKVSTSATSSIPTSLPESTISVPVSVTSSAATGGETAAAYGQCGGTGFAGATLCPEGWECKVQNVYYSQCVQS